jgi:beta-N-acetylhexosaminidase
VNAGKSSRRYGVSGTIFITFLLGICVGFTLCYAWLDISGIDLSGDAPGVLLPFFGGNAEKPENEKPEQDAGTAPDKQDGESKPPEPPPLFDAADLDGRWPAAHLFIEIPGTALTRETENMLASYKPGGIVLRPENLADDRQTQHLTAAIRNAAGLENEMPGYPLIAVAQEGGASDALNPLGLGNARSAAKLSDMTTPDAVREIAGFYALTARGRGINVFLAPVLDVRRENTPPEIAERCFSTSPARTAEMGMAFIDGLTANGVLPVVKHYPGAGAAQPGDNGVSVIASENVHEMAREMFPFAEAAARKSAGILAGHIAMPGLDKEAPGRPASLSPVLIQTVLRDQWGCANAVIADDAAALAEMTGRARAGIIPAAIAAGCDAVLTGKVTPEELEEICRAVHEAVDGGTLSGDTLAESRKRLNRWRNSLYEETDEESESPLMPEAPAKGRIPEPEEEAVPEAETAPEEETAETVGDTIETEPALEESETDTETEAARETEKTTTEEIEAGKETEAGTEAGPETGQAPAEEKEPGKEAEPEEESETAGETPDREAVYHLIERGETLIEIARQYQVAASDIIAWNPDIDPDNIKYGFRLRVYPPETWLPPAEAPAPAENNAREITHIVTSGDTRESIARKYGVAPENIAAWNDLGDTPVMIGESLRIHLPVAIEETGNASDEKAAPAGKFVYHTVARGDTLRKIADRYNTTPEAIIEANTLENPDIVQLGRRLRIPAPAE